MKIKYLMALLALLAGAAGLNAQTISTLVSATNGLNGPVGVAVDQQNNYYISDSGNNRIVVYTPSGALTNLAGGFGSGASNGPGVFATLNNPAGIVFARGGVVVADEANHLIRFISPSAVVSTLAGIAGQFGTNDGPGSLATFANPTALAVDGAGNIYVTDLSTGRLRVINPANVVSTLATGFYRPQGVAVDPSGNIYVADTGDNSIKLVSGGTVTLIAGSGSRNQYGLVNSPVGTAARFNQPTGLLWFPGTGLLVSDTGNGVLRVVSTNSQFGGYQVKTYFANAALAAPAGLAEDIYGNIVVTDGLNDSVANLIFTATQALPINPPEIGFVTLTITPGGPSTALTPVTSQVFNNDITAAILPQSSGVETFYSLGSSNILSSAPASASVPFPYADGDTSLPQSLFTAASAGPIVNIYAISIAPGSGRQPSAIVSAQFTFQSANPTINGIDPTDFSLSENTAGAQVVYTTDGSSPTNSASSQVYTSGQTLNILNGTNDVVFQVVATRQGFLNSTIISNTFHFSDVQTSLIGLNHKVIAGPGATVMLPITVKMSSTNVLHSLQYNVLITANGSAPLIPPLLQHIPITANDFVVVPTVATNVPQVTVTNNGPVTSIAITYAGDFTGFSASGEQTVAHIAVPIPANATYGQTYTVSIVAPSGTSDGRQIPIFLTPFSPATITVTNTGYLVGDSAPGNFYNARDFGNGLLDNSDVNNALYASSGRFVPPNFTDAFDAMDVFPVDQPGVPGGDGQIRFLDWNIILNRALGIDTNNWVRGWVTNPGGTPTRTNAQVTVALAQSVAPKHPPVGLFSVAKAQSITSTTPPTFVYSTNAPGSVWLRQATFGASPPDVLQPGQSYSIPVWVKVLPGCSLSGLQFVVGLIGNNGVAAPPVAFTLAAGLPSPFSSFVSSKGVAELWSLGAFNPSLTGSNLLGSLQFTVPLDATGTYSIVFAGADGAPPEVGPASGWVQYDFDNFNTVIGVGASAPTPASITSEQWKIHFWGANYAANPMSADSADPDGDGAPNWVEYLAGTDPTNADSHLNLSGSVPVSSSAANSVVVGWVSAPGKVYTLEVTSQLGGSWTVLPGQIIGDGNLQQITNAISASGALFYRLTVVPQ